MARNDPQINLRLPEVLKDGLVKAAIENNRSMNAEIVARLSASLAQSADDRSEHGKPIRHFNPEDVDNDEYLKKFFDLVVAESVKRITGK